MLKIVLITTAPIIERSKSAIQAVAISTTLVATALVFAKPYPAGIVNLASGQITATNTIANLAAHPWANPSVRGMRVKARWDYVEPLENSYDWAGLDQALRLGSQNGKFVGLSVAGGRSAPQWVYNAGATKYALRDGSGLSMPLPWDATFLSKWLSFVKALGQRYDGNPALGYVVMSGMGQDNETYLAKTAPDDAALTALGGAASWIVAAKTIITAYAQAFPTTPFFITMARPFPNTKVGVAALQQVVNWGVATYPGRFGLMTASLNAQSSTGYYPNEAIFTYRTTQPTGFQMLCSQAQDPVRLGGTVAQAVAKGYQLGGKFIEVYEPDVTGSVPGEALNLSSRLRVLSGEKSLIAGFIVSGPKRVILRGLGPSLQAFGVSGVLPNPILELHGSQGLITSNDSWKIGNAVAVQATGLAPKNDAESAIVTTLQSGAYTVILRDRNNIPGVGLLEIYDLDSQAPAKLLNISTRGFVDTGNNVMIAGFIIGPSGSGAATVLVMAKGPSLAAAGIQVPLQDPTLELHDGNGVLISNNDDWKKAAEQIDIVDSGLGPSDERESAIFTSLKPGAYTAIVRGKNNTTGIGLVEVYRLE
jgi:hypothetical protein